MNCLQIISFQNEDFSKELILTGLGVVTKLKENCIISILPIALNVLIRFVRSDWS